MVRFAAAVSARPGARDGAREACARARRELGDAAPALALAFASPAYGRLDEVAEAVEAELGPVALAGGTAGGGLFDAHGVQRSGVLVALVGGDVRVATATAPIASPDLVAVVPAAAQILAAADRAARDGLEDALCLAFAPAVRVDGEALVAALRKGTGARMQLAGALTGDDLTFDRAQVLADGRGHADRVVLAGLFTRTPVGVAARHGWRPVGPAHEVTRCDGPWLLEVDGRPALDVWLADARAADARPPADRGALVGWLADHFTLGLALPSLCEPLVRTPMALRDDGAVQLAASITEGATVHVMRASAREMLDASRAAAAASLERAGGRCTGGLVLACTGRLQALGDRFDEDASGVARVLGAPVAGVCVYGEIARAHREVDAFHNATAVVCAWPAA